MRKIFPTKFIWKNKVSDVPSKNFKKTKTRLIFYNELGKRYTEKFLNFSCQQKITNHIRLFIINKITKTFKVNITVRVQALLKYSSQIKIGTSPMCSVMCS